MTAPTLARAPWRGPWAHGLAAHDLDEVRRLLEAGVFDPDEAALAEQLVDALLTELTEPPARLSLKDFCVGAWPVVEPTTVYKPNWHLDAIDEHLEAWIAGDIRNLLLNLPPRHEKSLKAAVFLPTWVWTFWPSFRWLFSSYSQDLSTRDSVKCRRIIQSPWYQRQWGHRVQLTGDQNAKMRFENTATGYRLATSVEGMATGEGGDGVVVDDPHNVLEAESDAKRSTVLEWWDKVMSTRLNDPKTGRKMIVMQRLHERDLSGHVLAQGGYVHLELPTEYEPRVQVQVPGRYQTLPDPIPSLDPRTIPGALLWPTHFGATEVADAKLRLGSYGFAGQHQQRPAPAEGGIFKRIWWRYWQPDGVDLGLVEQKQADGSVHVVHPITLPPLAFIAQSWDMSFKDTKGSDMVCGQTWGKERADAFLLEQLLDRMDFVASIAAVRRLSGMPFGQRATAKWVEDKANGPAIISTLKREIPGLLPVNPEGDKVGRARAVSPYAESGNVYLPHPRLYTWVGPLIDSLASFPNAAHDDDVDALTQALVRLLRTTPEDDTPYATVAARYA